MWKRPSELCDDPHLLVDGASSTDVKQGVLGNCWFVAVCGSLAINRFVRLRALRTLRLIRDGRDLLSHVMPEVWEQDWATKPDRKKYNVGIFHFRFWEFGQVRKQTRRL